METVETKTEETVSAIEAAQKLIEQDRTMRITKVLEGMSKLMKENNCDLVVEMLVPFLGSDILITDKMLPQEKVKLTVIAK